MGNCVAPEHKVENEVHSTQGREVGVGAVQFGGTTRQPVAQVSMFTTQSAGAAPTAPAASPATEIITEMSPEDAAKAFEKAATSHIRNSVTQNGAPPATAARIDQSAAPTAPPTSSYAPQIITVMSPEDARKAFNEAATSHLRSRTTHDGVLPTTVAKNNQGKETAGGVQTTSTPEEYTVADKVVLSDADPSILDLPCCSELVDIGAVGRPERIEGQQNGSSQNGEVVTSRGGPAVQSVSSRPGPVQRRPRAQSMGFAPVRVPNSVDPSRDRSATLVPSWRGPAVQPRRRAQSMGYGAVQGPSSAEASRNPSATRVPSRSGSVTQLASSRPGPVVQPKPRGQNMGLVPVEVSSSVKATQNLDAGVTRKHRASSQPIQPSYLAPESKFTTASAVPTAPTSSYHPTQFITKMSPEEAAKAFQKAATSHLRVENAQTRGVNIQNSVDRRANDSTLYLEYAPSIASMQATSGGPLSAHAQALPEVVSQGSAVGMDNSTGWLPMPTTEDVVLWNEMPIVTEVQPSATENVEVWTEMPNAIDLQPNEAPVWYSEEVGSSWNPIQSSSVDEGWATSAPTQMSYNDSPMVRGQWF